MEHAIECEDAGVFDYSKSITGWRVEPVVIIKFEALLAMEIARWESKEVERVMMAYLYSRRSLRSRDILAKLKKNMTT